VLASIGTAYALFYFSNILEYLQVLVFFFIVPLFGTVIMGMLWKRATKAAGFWGFLIAIIASISMWVYVHTFPEGYRPAPRIVVGQESVVRLDKAASEKQEQILRVTVEKGTVDAINVPIPLEPGKSPLTVGQATASAAVTLAPYSMIGDKNVPVQILAPDVEMAGTGQRDKFGAQAVEMNLQPGVRVIAKDVTQHFVPSAFNPQHARLIARSEKAQGMAINMYSGFWVLLVSILANFVISLCTKPRQDAELKNLVYGLTPLPSQERLPIWRRPIFWAAVVAALLVAINILFW
jgi:hypothetical protein